MAGAASAQDARSWHATGFGGIGYAGDLHDTVPVFGVALARRWRGLVHAEAEIAFVPDLDRRPNSADVSVATVSATLIAYARRGANVGWTPYIVGGAALARLDDRSGALPLPAATDAAIVLGGGAAARLTRWFRARADVRYVHINDAPNFWRAYGGLMIRLR